MNGFIDGSDLYREYQTNYFFLILQIIYRKKNLGGRLELNKILSIYDIYTNARFPIIHLTKGPGIKTLPNILSKYKLHNLISADKGCFNAYRENIEDYFNSKNRIFIKIRDKDKADKIIKIIDENFPDDLEWECAHTIISVVYRRAREEVSDCYEYICRHYKANIFPPDLFVRVWKRLDSYKIVPNLEEDEKEKIIKYLEFITKSIANEEDNIQEKNNNFRNRIYNFETRARKFMKRVFSYYEKKWWNRTSQKIQKEIKETMKKQIRVDKQLGIFKKNYKKIQFIDFSRYSEIITSKHNWKFFEGILPPKNTTQTWLMELGRARNSVSHSRNLDSEELIISIRYIERLIGKISAWECGT